MKVVDNKGFMFITLGSMVSRLVHRRGEIVEMTVCRIQRVAIISTDRVPPNGGRKVNDPSAQWYIRLATSSPSNVDEPKLLSQVGLVGKSVGQPQK